jgi:hypothetical protein
MEGEGAARSPVVPCSVIGDDVEELLEVLDEAH